MDCMGTDPGNRKQYRALLYRNGFIEGDRFFSYMLDTKQLEDFAQRATGGSVAEISHARSIAAVRSGDCRGRRRLD
jgi:hypothetical protein